MKRLLVLALIVFGLGVFAAQTALSAGDAPGPPCTKITNGDGGYRAAGEIDFTVFLQAHTCSFVTYTFYVTDESGTTLISSTSSYDTSCTPENSGEGCVHFSVDLGLDSPDFVCVYATTDVHGHLADRAPDASCLIMQKGGAGASGTFG
jgi:hypothetical protein